MIGSAKVLTISTQKWTFWINSLTYLCCAERGQILSDFIQILNLGRRARKQLPKKIFFSKKFFFLQKFSFLQVHIFGRFSLIFYWFSLLKPLVFLTKINENHPKMWTCKNKNFCKKKHFFEKTKIFGSCGRALLPRFKFWMQSEKIWPLSAQHRYVKELVQNVPGVFEPQRIQSYAPRFWGFQRGWMWLDPSRFEHSGYILGQFLDVPMLRWERSDLLRLPPNFKSR